MQPKKQENNPGAKSTITRSSDRGHAEQFCTLQLYTPLQLDMSHVIFVCIMLCYLMCALHNGAFHYYSEVNHLIACLNIVYHRAIYIYELPI